MPYGGWTCNADPREVVKVRRPKRDRAKVNAARKASHR